MAIYVVHTFVQDCGKDVVYVHYEKLKCLRMTKEWKHFALIRFSFLLDVVEERENLVLKI